MYLLDIAIDELQQLVSHRRVIRHALEPEGFMLRYRHIHIESLRLLSRGFIQGIGRHVLWRTLVAIHQTAHSIFSTALANISDSRRTPELPELTGFEPMAIAVG